MPKNMPQIPITSHTDIRQLCPYIYMYIYIYIYIKYELTAVNNETRSTGILRFILLEYAPEQICLPYCTYIFHCIATVVYMDPTFLYI